MQPLFLTLEDGTVFEGVSVGESRECCGLLSFYTGIVGYQEVVSDPANAGKIVLFTYPLIGNYGVNSEDAESAGPKAEGVICRERPPYYSNFRAEGSFADYLESAGTVFGACFDTRAILLHLREHGEMLAVTSSRALRGEGLAAALSGIQIPECVSDNSPVVCDNARMKAGVIDLGGSRSFYRSISALGLSANTDLSSSDVVLVTDCPYYCVENELLIKRVAEHVGVKPVIGFGHGGAIVAQACGAKVARMKFGHHGANVPVRCLLGGRNEITVQNHNYIVCAEAGAEPLFENLHDGTNEGFVCRQNRAAGVNFVPGREWFDAVLEAVGVS